PTNAPPDRRKDACRRPIGHADRADLSRTRTAHRVRVAAARHAHPVSVSLDGAPPRAVGGPSSAEP
ncbi:hypothetical protein, partial [Nonomuraea mesophila]|uniref:hypothetical protein n=1 Tax=Nonomuraea mesophila TaxID=2530382 RepID=UPI001C709E16